MALLISGGKQLVVAIMLSWTVTAVAHSSSSRRWIIPSLSSSRHAPSSSLAFCLSCRISKQQRRPMGTSTTAMHAQISTIDNNNNIITSESENSIHIHKQLQSNFPFPLDSWQLNAGEAIYNNANVIVCAPTGAGKTVVGEMALRIALERSTKAIYTTPLKALSNQKFTEMRKVFGIDKVGLATGDVSIRRGADVTIMTTEVYRNMAWRANTNGINDNNNISSSSSLKGNSDEYSDLSSNSIVVLDEFHYMGQKGRGSTWEECIIFNPTHTQIVGLSATLPNAHRLASWMESVTGRTCTLIEANDKRPVPLRYYFVTKRDFAPLFRDELAGPGAVRGLLGLRGDGVVMASSPKMIKKNVGFNSRSSSSNSSRENESYSTINREGSISSLPRGLELNPTLQEAAERTSAFVDRQIKRILDRDKYTDNDEYGYNNNNNNNRRSGGRGKSLSSSSISTREQRRMKENLLKSELRKSVPSITTLLRRLEERALLPAIFFIFSRKGCDNAAEILCENLKTDAAGEKSGKNDRNDDNKKTKKKRKLMKGNERGRRSKYGDVNGDDTLTMISDDGMFEDENGRRFRADLLDQLLSDEYDSSLLSPSIRSTTVSVDDDTFLSETNLQYYAKVGLLTYDETKEVAARLLSFNTDNPEIAFGDTTVETLLCGIGSHHAGVLPAHKAFIETLFRVNLMKVVFATETLAAGINMPARTTVICSLAKRGDLGMELLETHNMLQMAGRAGRRGMDVEGACVIASTAFEGPEDAITILTNEVKPIVSQFTPSYSLAINLIERGGGKLDVAKAMVEKSFAVWELQQKEVEQRVALEGLDSVTSESSPGEQFLNTFQLILEGELIEARNGASPTGTSKSKLAALVDVLVDGKKLKKISKRYSTAAQILDLEQSTLQTLELELREMNSSDSDLPAELIDSEKVELMAEIKRQRQRVLKGQREVDDSILSAMAKVANNRMRDEYDGSKSLCNALIIARSQGDENLTPNGLPLLEPAELNSYIKMLPKNNRGPMLDQTTSVTSDDSDEEESWSQMLALIKVLEAYGCLRPLEMRNDDTNSELNRYNVTSGGEHVGSLGLDNSLWQLCALGGVWDVANESSELDKFQDAIADLLDEVQENAEESTVPKPQREAETLVNSLCQLSASEMAGYVSALAIDSPRHSDSALESFQKLTYPQQRVVQGALLSLERLVEVQRRLGLDEAIGKCQLELSACDVVTAWASGCSWNDALVLSGAAPGDLVRTLSRALDALRQFGNLPYIPARALNNGLTRLEASGIHPTVRSLCREAANAMDRYPVKDMLPFDEDDLESEDDVIEEEEEVDSKAVKEEDDSEWPPPLAL